MNFDNAKDLTARIKVLSNKNRNYKRQLRSMQKALKMSDQCVHINMNMINKLQEENKKLKEQYDILKKFGIC